MYTRLPAFLAASFVACAVPVLAADWPQWRGPDRTGVSKETGLLKEWPKEGPKQLWKNNEVGGGYSTPSVAGGRVYLLGSKDGQEYLIVLETENHP